MNSLILFFGQLFYEIPRSTILTIISENNRKLKTSRESNKVSPVTSITIDQFHLTNVPFPLEDRFNHAEITL